MPLPWVPGALARRVRGALVQDVAARHGVALAADARNLLADPSGPKKRRGALAEAFGFLGRKVLVRLGPLSALPPLRAARETFSLGYLFDRYLTRGRPFQPSGSGALRIDGTEAGRVREAIDRAVVRIASPERPLEWPRAPSAPEESRDEITQAVDSVLWATTTVPSWLLVRLDAAFDELLVSP